MRTLFLRSASLVVVLSAVFGVGVGAARAAEPGAAAPDFTLQDLDGKTVRLAELKGKVVVLEWFNPECPFVKAAHTKGSLVGLAKKYTQKGIVWLGVNSSAPGKQGNGTDKNRAGKVAFQLEHPILVDENGQVGLAYGATNTPHLFIIGKDQKLVYKGAIDNAADGEQGSPAGGKLVNYVDEAMQDLAAGKPVRTPVTKAYGCSVKYGTWR